MKKIIVESFCTLDKMCINSRRIIHIGFISVLVVLAMILYKIFTASGFELVEFEILLNLMVEHISMSTTVVLGGAFIFDYIVKFTDKNK